MARGEERLRLALAAVDKKGPDPRAESADRPNDGAGPEAKSATSAALAAREAKPTSCARRDEAVEEPASAAAKAGRSPGPQRSTLAHGSAQAGCPAAAAYEKLGVRLRVVSRATHPGPRRCSRGSTLATRTPFSLEEPEHGRVDGRDLQGATRSGLAEFTSIASDLAAAYGRPVEQRLARTLQRAFGSAFGSADVLREAGISAEILRITGASKVSEVSAAKLGDALRS
ncbi:MAG: hypothetical protein R3F16_09160 [Myxococcota bacterium]